ncbi:MAG: CsgG/HfaB family protein [Planctomycetota bacterium]
MILRPGRCVFVGVMIVSLGCASTSSSVENNTDASVGNYAAAPAGLKPRRFVVYPFENRTNKHGVEGAAADQANTLWLKTNRFRMIERTQLDKVIAEQGLGGKIDAATAAKAGHVIGAELLCLGAVTDFEVKKSKTGFGGSVLVGLGLSKEKTELDIQVGVDMRVVDATSGEIVIAEHSDIKRTESASALGFDVLGFRSEAEAEVELSQDNQGRILRIAIDDVIKRLLPALDTKLAAMETPAGQG